MSLVDIWQLPPPSSPATQTWRSAAGPVQAALLGNTPKPQAHKRVDDPWAVEDYPLMKFVQEAWHIVRPGQGYIHGWHIEALCLHLEAVARRDIKRLLINVPMRSSKSTILAVFFQAWTWITHPETSFLVTSYKESLALRDSVACRTLLRSSWYKERWGDRFRLSGDMNIKSRFENDKGGYRVTAAIGGATGEGADILVCLPAGQRVITNEGWLPIDRIVDEHLQVQVLSFNHQTQMIEWQPILAYHRHEMDGKDALYHLAVHNGPLSCALEITGNHPVYIKGKGYIPTSDVHLGDIIFSSFGGDTGWQERIVTDIFKVATATTVYNLAITNNNNYFAEGILLHNCDDLHSRTEEESATRAKIEVAKNYFNMEFSSCLSDPQTSCIVVSGQRVSLDDVSADILAKGGWEHLKIRQEYVPPPPGEPKPCTSIGWSDPRTELGELMWPVRWGPTQVATAKKELSRNYYAFHQQDPEASGGTLFKDDWWKVYTEWPDMNAFKKIIHTWDMRFKDDKEEGSFVVGECWGLSPNGMNAFLLDEVRGRWGYVETKEAFAGFCAKWPQARVKLIENKANGPAIYSDFRSKTFGIILVDPEGSKLARAERHTSTAEAGQIWIPSEQLAPWITEWRHEMQHYPSDPNDRGDAGSQAWDYLLPRQLADDPRTEERKERARRQRLVKRVQQSQKMTWSRTGA